MKTTREDDLQMLEAILARYATMTDDDEAFSGRACDAFADMKSRLGRGGPDISEKARRWIRGVHEKLFGSLTYENAWSAGKVPRGAEVKTPAVLLNLPKRPPGR